MTASYQPKAEDFAPARRHAATEQISRPSLAYWEDAWIRLKKNRRSLISLWIIISLLLFTLVGPLLWPVIPAAQDLTQISLGPTMGRSALLIDSDMPNSLENTTTTSLAIAGIATTEAIHLHWPSIPDTQQVRLYRHEYEPSSMLDLGLPLAHINPNQLTYRDTLMLENIDYYYSLVAVINGQPTKLYPTIKVSTRQAISIQQAMAQNLVNEKVMAGTEIMLPAHPLGTNYLGRDMLARMMYGARTSLFIGVVAPLIFMLTGIFYGGISGFIGGSTDREMMRLSDFVLALPFLLFMILFKIMFGIGPGESGVMPMLVALVLLSWPATARLVRGQVMQIRNLPYIEAAELMGAKPGYIIVRHMLPNLLNVVLVSLTFAIPTAIFTEAFLSFIGMGVVPPTPSWGSMCNDGIRNMLSHPHELIFPALFISVTVLAFNLLGDGLRDSLDIKMRARQ